MLRKRMSEDRKLQAKTWTLVDTGDVDAEEHMRSIDDRISKGHFFIGKTNAFLYPSQ